jgi:iron complex transport system permease protein
MSSKALFMPRNNTGILMSLTALLVVMVLVSLSLGAFEIPLSHIPSLILHSLGISVGEVDFRQYNVLMHIRMPRVILAILVGGGLALAGAALQGLFRNPLVEPGLIGVSSGAALFAVIYIVFGLGKSFFSAEWNMAMLSLFAFAGGAVNTLMVYQLATLKGNGGITMLILAGIALNALCGALIGLSIFYADDAAMRSFTFWSLGDLAGANWNKILIASLLMVPGVWALIRLPSALDAMALGEAEAFHMGFNVKKIKYSVITASALLVGVAVSLSGTIGFVGLIVPHLVRMSFGTSHRLVLPASLLLGALLLIVADTLARTVVAPAEIPIGIITAILGAPFFIWLIATFKRA